MEPEGHACPTLPPAVRSALQRQLEALDFAFCISDCSSPDMPITFASSSFYTMTGYTAAEVIGKNCRFLQGKGTEKRKVMEIRDAIREDRSCQVCLLNYKKDGTPFWNQLYCSPVRDDQDRTTHYLGVQTDVTQHMERRRSMELPPTLLTTALREAPLRAPGGPIPQRRQQQQQQQQRQQEGDGSGGSPEAGSSDLSEDDEVPAALVEAQRGAERLTSFMAAAHVASTSLLPSSLTQALLKVQQSFVLSDPRLPDCPIVHASQSFLDMTGYSREEVVGRNCRLLQGPGTDPAEVARLSAALSARPPRPVTVTLLNYTKEGRPWWNCLHVAPVNDADGALEFFVGVQLDVTQVTGASSAAAGCCDAADAPPAGGPAAYGLPHRMAHFGATGAVKVACRGLAGHQGGLRRSMDCAGLPRKGLLAGRAASCDAPAARCGSGGASSAAGPPAPPAPAPGEPPAR